MRRSVLAPTRNELDALISTVFGTAARETFRAASRHQREPLIRADVPEHAWHPKTRLSGNPARRGTSNANERGSAEDRRRRKVYLLDTYGDGFSAPCAFCRTPLTFSTMTVDRYPQPGRAGGRYTRDNIRPACMPCNSEDGGRAAHGRPRKAGTCPIPHQTVSSSPASAMPRVTGAKRQPSTKTTRTPVTAPGTTTATPRSRRTPRGAATVSTSGERK